ncbi:hypothetical protein DI291_0265 [Bacillus paralicheniformis]|nr:hypothetical protein DI291_0265 [Bacillus paralicheniformis]
MNKFCLSVKMNHFIHADKPKSKFPFRKTYKKGKRLSKSDLFCKINHMKKKKRLHTHFLENFK